MPHLHCQVEARVSPLQNKIFCFWICDLNLCLTLLDMSNFFLNLVMKGEAYASCLSNEILCFKFVFLGWDICIILLDISKFFFKLVLRGEAHASPLSNEIMCFEFEVWRWGTCLNLLDMSNIFLKLVLRGEAYASCLLNSMFWICVLGVRHMPYFTWYI